MRNLRVLNLKISFILLLFFALGCSDTAEQTTENKPTESRYTTISNYFKERHQVTITDSIKAIFVLTDNGCGPCNKHFSELMASHMNTNTSLFLILASGTNIDLSEFKQSKSKIYYDKPENIAHHLFDETKAIFIQHQKIDTTITIDARLIDYQFSEINKLVKIYNP
jgi:hypothetical protein